MHRCWEHPSPKGSLNTQTCPFAQLSHVHANWSWVGGGGGGWQSVSHCGRYEHFTLLQ